MLRTMHTRHVVSESQRAVQAVRTGWARSFMRHAERMDILGDLTHAEISRAVALRDAGREPVEAARVIAFERWN